VTDGVVAGVADALDPGPATVDRITVGDAAVLVELAGVEGGEAAGLAHRPPGAVPETADGDVDVETLVAWARDDDAVARAIGLATMNALSVPHVEWRTGDPMALLDPDVDRITTVGLFRPALRKFSDVDLRVIEREPMGAVSAPAGVRVATFMPDATASAMAGTEVVFLTGSAFVYGGAEAYLDAAPTSATVVVIGATASFLPGPLFEAGVDVVAGATVTDAAGVRAALRRGDCGTDLHDAGLRKVYVAPATPSRIRLDASGGSGISNE